MDIPADKQYEYLTAHLQYLDEKIIQSFTLFIELATAIVGSAFYLHWKLAIGDPKRASLAQAVNGLFFVVSVGTILLILNNLCSWRGYRRTLSKQYPDTPKIRGFRWWFSEAVICSLIAGIFSGFYFWWNPLSH